MHEKRCYVSVVTLNDEIYAIGGYDGTIRLSTAEKYNLKANQWTRIAQMHSQRSDASACCLDGDGTIFLFLFCLLDYQ